MASLERIGETTDVLGGQGLVRRGLDTLAGPKLTNLPRQGKASYRREGSGGTANV